MVTCWIPQEDGGDMKKKCPTCGQEIIDLKKIDLKQVAEDWNRVAAAHSFPKIRMDHGLVTTRARVRKLSRTLREWPDFWPRLEHEVALLASWVRDAKWFTFDWCLEPRNSSKLFEGNYRDGDRWVASHEPTPPSSEEQLIEKLYNAEVWVELAGVQYQLTRIGVSWSTEGVNYSMCWRDLNPQTKRRILQLGRKKLKAVTPS
jgi:hypothetical protein